LSPNIVCPEITKATTVTKTEVLKLGAYIEESCSVTRDVSDYRTLYNKYTIIKILNLRILLSYAK
jgi:hypothetical protein